MSDADVKRFWAKVAIVNDEESCWLWRGTMGNTGYGVFKVGRRNILAHRYSYLLVCGGIPPELFCCHHCDCPKCCRPTHLFLGTPADNTHDAVYKDRMACGEKHGTHLYPETVPRGERHWARTNPERVAKGEKQGSAILTTAHVREIRRLWNSTSRPTQRVLAAQYNVTQTAISSIIHGKTWKHID